MLVYTLVKGLGCFLDTNDYSYTLYSVKSLLYTIISYLNLLPFLHCFVLLTVYKVAGCSHPKFYNSFRHLKWFYRLLLQMYIK